MKNSDGTDADVRAARKLRLAEGRDDVEERALVGDEVVGVEIAARLGELRDACGEARGRLDLPDAGGAGHSRQGKRDCHDAEQKTGGHGNIIDGELDDRLRLLSPVLVPR